MSKRIKRKKRVLSIKERKKKMLKSSEWVLLGILSVAIFEILVNYYGLTWRYLPYAFAVCGVIVFRVFLSFMRIFTKGVSFFLDNIKDV